MDRFSGFKEDLPSCTLFVILSLEMGMKKGL